MTYLDKNIEAELTNFEKKFFSESSRASRQKSRENQQDEFGKKEPCYVPELDVNLVEFMDIAKLFSNRKRFGEFLDILFAFGMTKEHRGSNPFLYNRKGQNATYVFDYNFILSTIIEWSVKNLKANESEIRRFISKFSSTNDGDLKRKNYFLAVTIFSHMYKLNILPYTSFVLDKKNGFFLNIKYFTPYVVAAADGNEYYYIGIPFSGSEVLKYLSEDIAVELMSRRAHIGLRQVLFSHEVFNFYKKGNAKHELFWEIAHPKIDRGEV